MKDVQIGIYSNDKNKPGKLKTELRLDDWLMFVIDGKVVSCLPMQAYLPPKSEKEIKE